MRRFALASLVVVAAIAPAAAAEPNRPSAPAVEGVLAPPVPAIRESTAPVAPRRLSPQATARLIEASPTFEELQESSAAAAAPAPPPAVDDRPRNGILRLPRYLVQEPRAPVLTERELLTPQGKIELGMQRHPGFKLGSWGIFTNAFWAREMIEQEFALERQREMYSLMSLLPTTLPPSPTLSPFSLVPSATFSSPWRSQQVPWERH